MSNSPKLQRFIEKSNLMHANKYDYSLVVYIRTTDKVDIICPIHGIFKQDPMSHKRGTGCPTCATLRRQTTRSKQTVEYKQSVIEKRKQTCMDRYGTVAPLLNAEVKNKSKSTCLEKYGNEQHLFNRGVQEKRKQTMVKRYGVEFSGQSQELTTKREQSCLLKYGSKSSLSNKEVQRKVKCTMMMKHGVEYSGQSFIKQEKTKQTMMERYGVEYSGQSPLLQLKKKQTMVETYSVESNKHFHMTDTLSLLEDHEWMNSEYVDKKKSATQISKELGVSVSCVVNYIHKHDFPIRYKNKSSSLSNAWIKYLIESLGIYIQYSESADGEFKIPGTIYRVDGYCAETNTIYEFHGDVFHGNPKLFESNDNCHPFDKTITAGELYQATIERENKIKSLGYNLVVMWESDWKPVKR